MSRLDFSGDVSEWIVWTLLDCGDGVLVGSSGDDKSFVVSHRIFKIDIITCSFLLLSSTDVF